jgi:hypothetical protein
MKREKQGRSVRSIDISKGYRVFSNLKIITISLSKN